MYDCGAWPVQNASRVSLRILELDFVSLSKDQVKYIATLARLTIADDEVDDVVDKLSRIVARAIRLRHDANDLVGSRNQAFEGRNCDLRRAKEDDPQGSRAFLRGLRGVEDCQSAYSSSASCFLRFLT